MPDPAWADRDDVKERLGVAATAKGYTTADIDSRLVRAEERIRAHLQTFVSSDTIDAWSSTTVPPIVKGWVCDMAAAFMLADFFGQSLQNKDDHAGGLYLSVVSDLRGLKQGEINIVDTAGDDVEAAEDMIESDKLSRTAHISMTHADDGDAGDGSMDDF